jgi:hypothetical protein
VNTRDEDDWITELLKNAPPAPTPEELAKAARDERAAEASECMRRLPEYLRRPQSDLRSAIKAEAMLHAADDWHPGQGGNLLLIGERDEGKSTAAAVACRRLLRLGVDEGGVAWSLVRELRWFAATWLEKAIQGHPFGKGICPEMRLATNASLLVLDDLGWEKDPRTLSPILSARWEAQRPTIITSGLTMNQLLGGKPDEFDAPCVHPGFGGGVIKRVVTLAGRRSTVARSFPKRDAAKAKAEAKKREAAPVSPHFQEAAEG